MNKAKKSVLAILSLVVCLIFFLNDAAEARRMGGGRSFGSRPTYQRSAPAPTQNVAPNRATDQTIGQKTGAGMSPSPFGRFGGMMGGLLMGGLIGSLLFGGGHGFGGPGLLDILLIGGGLFFLMRFLRARRQTAMGTASPAGSARYESESAAGWNHMGYTPSGSAPANEMMSPPFPPDFDEAEFLKGANSLYTRLQNSWDKRDLADIRQFTSDEVYSEIAAQAKEDPRPGRTELLLINPRIVEVRELGSQTIATVLFDVMMREDGDDMAKQVRELWHFSRDTDRADSFWTLEGIQQVE